MTAEAYLRFAAMIAATGGVVYALLLMWQHVICPGWRFVMNVVRFAEAQPVLLAIAKEFKPNDGATLRDQVDRTNKEMREIKKQVQEQAGSTNIRLANIEGQMEILVQHVTWDGHTERRTDEERRVDEQ